MTRNKVIQEMLRKLCEALASDSSVEQYTREVAQSLVVDLTAPDSDKRPRPTPIPPRMV